MPDGSLYYALKYPPTTVAEEAATSTATRPNVAGAFILCPMVEGKSSNES